MFVLSKTHQRLVREHQDLQGKQHSHLALLRAAQQIFASIPASRLSQGVKDQIASWQRDVESLIEEKGGK